MTNLSLSKFADSVSGIMPVIMKEYIRYQGQEFHKLKMTVSQFLVLEMLTHKAEVKMSDLARDMGVTTAAMTGAVERLVRDGYVERVTDERDRRIVKVRLTSKGARGIKNLIEKRKQITIKMFGAISSAEREQYLKILTHIHKNLQG